MSDDKDLIAQFNVIHSTKVLYFFYYWYYILFSYHIFIIILFLYFLIYVTFKLNLWFQIDREMQDKVET